MYRENVENSGFWYYYGDNELACREFQGVFVNVPQLILV